MRCCLAQLLVTRMPSPVMCPSRQGAAGVASSGRDCAGSSCLKVQGLGFRGLLPVCGRVCLCMHGGSVSRSTCRLQHRPAGFACGLKLQQSRLQAA